MCSFTTLSFLWRTSTSSFSIAQKFILRTPYLSQKEFVESAPFTNYRILFITFEVSVQQNYGGTFLLLLNSLIKLDIILSRGSDSVITARKTKFAKVMFLHMSVCPGGGSPGPHPGGRLRATLGGCIPTCTEADPSHTKQTATAAGGTHPTGMPSC